MFEGWLHSPNQSGLQAAGDARSRDRIRWVGFVLFYAIVANVPFWIAGHWFALLPLGWFCVEYAGVGLLALFVPPALSAALLLLAIAADLISAVSKTYYLPPSECLMNLGALAELPGARLGEAVGLIAVTLLILAVALFFPVKKIRGAYRSYAALCLIGFAVVSVSADCVSVVRETGRVPNPFGGMRPGDANKFSDYGNLWIARYPSLRLARNERLFGGGRNTVNASPGGAKPIASAAAVALRTAGIDSGRGPQEMPNFVLVLVESWGLDSDASVRDALVRPYTQPGLAARYDVSQGTVKFFGPTVGGEARELCGSDMGYQIEDLSTQSLRPCLPDRLASLGYHTIALHGMSGYMFHRQTWYRSIGFQEQWFRDSFRQRGLPDCVGAFVGTCDAAVAGLIGQRLQTRDPSPDFVYWVTLNSHLPLPVPSGLPGAASCALTPLLTRQATFCSWYQLVANVHDSVARLAMGQMGRPTVFVIVGDHAPPFANPTLRDQFSGAEVPYVLLVPRPEELTHKQENRAANGR
jgi:hypothetical protein